MTTTIKAITQNEMVVFQEYKVIGKGGKIFILMRDTENNLYKLATIDQTLHHKHYTKIKSLQKPHVMTKPTQEDYNLFLKCE